MKNLFKILFLLFVVTGGLFACSSGEETGTKSEGEGKKEITILIDNATNRAGMEAVAKFIEEEHGIAAKFEIRPGGTEGDNLVKTRLSTGDMADIAFYNSGSKLQELNPTEHFVDLTNEPFMEKVLDEYKQSVTVDGKVFGIPAESSQVGGVIYNKKIYEDLGLSIPKTWDEFMENNKIIKDAGITPVLGTYRDTWTAQIIILGDYYNVEMQEPSFAEEYTANKSKFATTPAALRSFEKLASLYEEGFLNADFLSTGYDQGLKMLANGDVAHWPILSGSISNIAQNYPDKLNDFGIFPIPSDDPKINGFTVWLPSSFYIYKHSENVETALKWAELFLSEEGIQVYLENQAIAGPIMVEGVELPDDVAQVVVETLPYFESGNITSALEFKSPLKGPNLEQISVEVASGIIPPEEGAKLYDNDVEKQAKQLGLEGW